MGEKFICIFIMFLRYIFSICVSPCVTSKEEFATREDVLIFISQTNIANLILVAGSYPPQLPRNLFVLFQFTEGHLFNAFSFLVSIVESCTLMLSHSARTTGSLHWYIALALLAITQTLLLFSGLVYCLNLI